MITPFAVLVRNRSKVVRIIVILLFLILLSRMFEKYAVRTIVRSNKSKSLFESLTPLRNDNPEPEENYHFNYTSYSFSNCSYRLPTRQYKIQGNYTVLVNFLVAENAIQCNEGVTYTTHSDFRYLDNLFPLVERWLAPISIAVYTPASDFQDTLIRIAYVRECRSDLVKKWVTFHLFSESQHLSDPLSMLDFLQSFPGGCNGVPTFNDSFHSECPRYHHVYPINVARNIARREALTYFVLASDIELYPSINVSRKFIEFQNRESTFFGNYPRPHVFVLPIFEVTKSNVSLPTSKIDLAEELERKNARIFHQQICPLCHQVPKWKEWIANTSKEVDCPMNIFHVAKRPRGFFAWEPIYIGTNQDPYFDERFSWEGLLDKMAQVYALCLLNFDFLILDNAFLIHRHVEISGAEFGGIHKKEFKSENSKLRGRARKELRAKYGTRAECDGRGKRKVTKTIASSNKSTTVSGGVPTTLMPPRKEAD